MRDSRPARLRKVRYRAKEAKWEAPRANDPRPHPPVAQRAAACGRHLAGEDQIVVVERPETAKGITFVLLEDERGSVNLSVPSQLYERRREMVRSGLSLTCRRHHRGCRLQWDLDRPVQLSSFKSPRLPHWATATGLVAQTPPKRSVSERKRRSPSL